MGLALKLLEGAIRLVLHLHVQNLHSIESIGGGPIDALRNRDPAGALAKLPERIGRNADRVGPRRGFAGGCLAILTVSSRPRGAAGKPDHRSNTHLFEKSPTI